MGTTDADLDRTAVIILAGGLGTRLKSVTGDTPKPLVPILGRPFLEYLLDHLRSMGLAHLFVTASYRFDLMHKAIAQYRARTGSTVVVLEEPVAAGTFGAVLQAEPQVPRQFGTFLILNGDSLINADYRLALSALDDRDGVVAGVRVADCDRFGALRVDAAGRLRAFAEKASSGPGTINAGVYAFRRSAILGIPVSLPASMEFDFMPVAVSSLNVGFADLGSADFIDIGTPASYEAAEQFDLIKRLRTDPVRL
jgi:D-glycero-alpha-D-manno-heptose 1-phosphate guanylyltransferase